MPGKLFDVYNDVASSRLRINVVKKRIISKNASMSIATSKTFSDYDRRITDMLTFIDGVYSIRQRGSVTAIVMVITENMLCQFPVVPCVYPMSVNKVWLLVICKRYAPVFPVMIPGAT